MSFTNAQKQAAHVQEIVKRVFSDMIMRPDWGAKYRNGYGDRSAYYPLDRTFLHHSVTAMIAASASVATESAAVRSIEQIGQNRFGVGMSYNCLSPTSGRLYQGTGFSRISAHTGGFNTSGFALCFIGNYETHKLSAEQKVSAAELAVACWAEGIFAQPEWTNCHRDVFATSCPGGHACSERRQINAMAADMVRGDKPGTSRPKPAPKPASTRWPAKKLSNPFGRSNPFTRAGAAGRNPLDNWHDIVPGGTQEALSKALAGAGFKRSSGSKWGREKQVRDWLLRHSGKAKYTRYSSVLNIARRYGGNGFGNPASIWAAYQCYLADQGHYGGAIDGQPGAQTWWAIVEWLNKIRPAYQ